MPLPGRAADYSPLLATGPLSGSMGRDRPPVTATEGTCTRAGEQEWKEGRRKEKKEEGSDSESRHREGSQTRTN